MCNKEVLVRKLREHLWTCTEGLDSDEPNNDDVRRASHQSSSFSAPPIVPQSSSAPPSLPQASSSSSAPPSVPQSSSAAPPSLPRASSSSSAPPSEPQPGASTTPPSVPQSSSAPPSVPQSSSTPLSLSRASSLSTAPPTIPQQSPSSTAPPNVPQQSSSSSAPASTSPNTSTETQRVATVDLTQTPNVENYRTVEEVVNGTVAFCKEKNFSHVEILRCFQQKMVIGRALEVQNVVQTTEGDTNYINVDRYNLMETTFDEIMFLEEYRKTFIQVQFYGEVCMILY